MRHTIKVVDDFCPNPFGRYISDDPERSAEKFRDNILIPALKDNDFVTVDLSDSNDYSSSFLEETFGGLVRAGFTEDVLDRKLEIVHEQLPSIVAESSKYIQQATKRT